MITTTPIHNRLVFPAGRAPGFDPSHPAARGIVRFSGICPSPGDFVNILNGKKGTVVGTKSGKINAGGPFAAGADTNYFTFSGNPTATDIVYTMAAIFTPEGTEQGDQKLFCNHGTIGGALTLMAIGDGTSLKPGENINGVGTVSPTTIPSLMFGTAGTNGGPVFMIVSRQPGGASPVTNAYSRTLKNGVGGLWAPFTDFGYAAPASDGTYRLGGNGVGPGNGANAGIHAVMFSNTPMSQQEMAAWGEDPWSFWYPQQDGFLQAQTLTPPIPTVPRFNSTKRVIAT